MQNQKLRIMEDLQHKILLQLNKKKEESAEEKHAHGMIAIGLYHCIREWQDESGIDVLDSDFGKEFIYSDV